MALVSGEPAVIVGSMGALAARDSIPSKSIFSAAAAAAVPAVRPRLFLRDRHFVTLDRKRILGILAKRQSIDLRHAVGRVVKF